MSQQRSPFIFIRRWRGALLAGIVALAILVALGFGVIRFGWDWTSFTGGYSRIISRKLRYSPLSTR